MDSGTNSLDRRWTLETLSESERESQSLLVYTKGGQLKMQNNFVPFCHSLSCHLFEIGIEWRQGKSGTFRFRFHRNYAPSIGMYNFLQHIVMSVYIVWLVCRNRCRETKYYSFCYSYWWLILESIIYRYLPTGVWCQIFIGINRIMPFIFLRRLSHFPYWIHRENREYEKNRKLWLIGIWRYPKRT